MNCSACALVVIAALALWSIMYVCVYSIVLNCVWLLYDYTLYDYRIATAATAALHLFML